MEYDKPKWAQSDALLNSALLRAHKNDERATLLESTGFDPRQHAEECRACRETLRWLNSEARLESGIGL